jgi:predicted dehydrogenase
MGRRTNRRQFLKQTAAAGIGFWVAGGVALRADSKSPNQRLNIACIGVGGKGGSDSSQAGKVGTIIALCDVDARTLNKKAEEFKDAARFSDFREMLTKLEKEIDAVTVSTPDHTHAAAAVMAMKMKKHVYCQKPLTHAVYEARVMRDTARKMGVVTQMGNQGSASDGLRRAVEAVQAGIIGKVSEAHVWTNRPVWPQAPTITARPERSDPVPDYLNWDCWLGPAPERPYVGNRTYHDFNWRGWWDFGTGALGDMACHTANMAFRALKLEHPTTIESENGEINPETYPAWARITFQFPKREEMPPVKFVWYEGHRDKKQVLPSPDLVKGQGERDKGDAIYFKDDKWLFKPEKPRDPKNPVKNVTSGSFLVGEKGVLFSPDDYGGEAYIVTKDGVEKLTGKPEKLPSNNHGDGGMKEEWAAAINGGPKPYSNFDFAAMLTETILLGNVAMRAGKKLEWDGPGLKITNVADANKFLKTEYRKGWTL